MAIAVIECVPNFSEGRDRGKLKQITDAIEGVSGATLLNVEPGWDTHRTVVTFIGDPEAAAQAAFAAIARAAQVIDMSTHAGAHPRMGATDVCPFVPVEGATMQDCVALARRLGERVGRELGIPVYLYGEAASRPGRRNLAEVRKGEYEGLPKKLGDPAWAPDFGPAAFNARSGASAIGAREFLIAYNVNLNSTDKGHAADIAFALREKGRVSRSGNTKPFYSRGSKRFYGDASFPCGTCGFVAASYDATRAHCGAAHGYDLDELLRANDLDPPNLAGQTVFRPGAFKECKAIGWYVEDYQRAQVSINLTNYKVTPAHAVLEEARRLAAERGLVVTGSEVVGLIPYQALLETGRFYLARQGRTLGLPVPDVLRIAVSSLGLGDVAPFDIDKKVLGLPATPAGALVRMAVRDFVDEVSRDTPAPGGGSIAALAGALGAALASMVANLTHGKEGTEARDADLARIAAEAQQLKDRLVAAVDDDSAAFKAFLEARRLPKNTAEEKEVRQRKMQEGLKLAVEVPWSTALASFEAMRLARQVAEIGNPSSITDAAVGVEIGLGGVRGGVWNVVINLKDITDDAFVADMEKKSAELLGTAVELGREAAAFVDGRLADMLRARHAKRSGS